MRQRAITVLLFLVGIINLYPVIGIMSPEQFAGLYGLDFSEDNLQVLMRHRALMFGLLGGFIIYAAFRPAYRQLAFIAGFVSMLGFIVFAVLVDSYNTQIAGIVRADIIALILLLIASVLYINELKNGQA